MHYIIFPKDPQQCIGVVRMRVQTADEMDYFWIIVMFVSAV